MTTPGSTSILSLFQLTADQQAAATAREAAISVTAGAGSGKTRALVGRYLALLEAGLPLRSLVAITFTDKAAREMRNRIRAIATAWLAHEAATTNRELWQEAFSALDSARISTIHGLCAAILRAHPAEAGLDPAFGLLDEGQSAVWRARAVEAGLAWTAADPEVSSLFGLFLEAQLRHLVSDLLERRLDAGQILATLPANPLAQWTAGLNQWFARQFQAPGWQDSLATLAQVRAGRDDDKLELARQGVLAAWAEARRAQGEQDWDGLFEALASLRQSISSGGQKNNWATGDLTIARESMVTLRTYFDEMISQLVDPKKPLSWRIDQQVAGLLPLARRLFEQTQAIYQGYKTEAHVLDFDDLEQLTADLLSRNAAVRRRWQREINAVLLVDEFQDTNQRQREIVYALANFEAGERTLELSAAPAQFHVPLGASPSPTSLFVVGDAKQSIYRFRGADVSVFRQVQADIRQAGGALIDFNLTFRAHQALVEQTNALLAPLMAAQDDPSRPYEVPFAPLKAHRSKPRAGLEPPFLEFQLGLGEDKQVGRYTAAVNLAQRLYAWRQAGQIDWPDVALLFRASTAFGVYENALEQAGIPFVTVAGRGFYDRPEVRDLLNALTALADPTDDLAMAGLLRSPAIGLSDAALYRLRWGETQRRRPFWPTLQNLTAIEGLSEADQQRAELARQLIADLHAQAGRITVAQLLKAFLDATHYRAALRLAPGGERLRRNIDKLLADAHRSELVSIAEFLEYLTALSDVGARESEAPTEAGGAVQLMTIHKAKGLEFPVVVLADAGYTGGFRSAPFYLDARLGLLLNLTAGEAQAAAYRLAARREAEQEAAEERRLLYVAATRAMEKFIISGDAKLSTAKATPGRLLLSGWLAQLAEVVGLSELQLPEMPASPQVIALAWQEGTVACTIYPPVSRAAPEATLAAHRAQNKVLTQLPDLLAPVTIPPPAESDSKLQDRERHPPPRVWRVAPPTPYDVPAWVVGSLTHQALRHWRFPDAAGFAGFLRPLALEAGLTDVATVGIALHRVTELLARFQAHPLYAQLSTAERHHEVPYSVTFEGRTRSGLIDLMFRASPAEAWTIAEFITDRLPDNVDLHQHALETGYDHRAVTYRQVIAQQMDARSQTLLVFLNVGQAVRVLNFL